MLRKAVIVTMLIAGVPCLASAQNQSSKPQRIYSQISAPEFQAVLQRLGYNTEPARPRADGISELIGKIDRLNYSVVFYRCDKASVHHCSVYQLWARFSGSPVTAERINEWNRTQWLATAYLGNDGAARIDITVRIEGGVTEANIAAVMSDFRAALKEFTAHIGWE